MMNLLSSFTYVLALSLVVLSGSTAGADQPFAGIAQPRPFDIPSETLVVERESNGQTYDGIAFEHPAPTIISSGDDFGSTGGLRRELKSKSSNSSSTKTEHVNIFQKLKESLVLAIIGILLLCLSPVVLWKNEGRHVRELKRIDFCKNNAIAVDCESPVAEDTGRLVHFVGNVTVGDAALDLGSGTTYGSGSGGLNVTSPVPRALLVKRTCFIYQKFENAEQTTKKDMVGGGETRTTEYTVQERWTEFGPSQETLEHLPDEVNNRGVWDALVEASAGNTGDASAGAEVPQGLAVTGAARVGDFGIPRELILDHPGEFSPVWEPVPNELLPESVDGCEGLARGSDNILRTFSEEDGPKNGDCKVVYEYIADGFECSFIVEQAKSDPEMGAGFGVEKCDVVDEQCFGKCSNDLGTIWMVRRGRHDLEEMIDLATEEENALVKVVRFIGWVAIWAGWGMLFTPFTTTLQVLPFLSWIGGFAVSIAALITSCLCSCTVVTAAYVRYRPLFALGLLTLAGGIWGIVIWRLDVAAKTAG